MYDYALIRLQSNIYYPIQPENRRKQMLVLPLYTMVGLTGQIPNSFLIRSVIRITEDFDIVIDPSVYTDNRKAYNRYTIITSGGIPVDEMSKEQILDFIAPCSLLCYSCPGFTRGIVCELSGRLHNYFEGFYEFRVNTSPEEYKSRADSLRMFIETLSRLAKPRCNGCRHNPDPDSRIKGCFVLKCTQEHGIDYCGECKLFPCSKVDTTLFNPVVYNRWLKGNKRIRKVGVEQFFEEEKGKSHYIDWVRDENE